MTEITAYYSYCGLIIKDRLSNSDWKWDEESAKARIASGEGIVCLSIYEFGRAFLRIHMEAPPESGYKRREAEITIRSGTVVFYSPDGDSEFGEKLSVEPGRYRWTFFIDEDDLQEDPDTEGWYIEIETYFEMLERFSEPER